MKPHSPKSFALAALLCAAAPGAEAASRVTILHAAPTLGSALRFEVSGSGGIQALTLGYREHASVTIDNQINRITIRALRPDGSEIAVRAHPIRDHLDYFVALSRDGERFELVQSLDTNARAFHGAGTLQIGNLSPQLTRMRVRSASGTTETLFAYRGGFEGSANVAGASADGCCTITLRDDAGFDETRSFTVRAGGHYRAIAVGDGVAAPREVLWIEQSVEPTVGVVDPTAAMEGVWYAPDEPGVGFSVALSPGATPTDYAVDILVNGYDPGGSPSWSLFRADRSAPGTTDLSTYGGGTPDGATAAIPLVLGFAVVQFHNCDEATLTLTGNVRAGALRERPSPANALRIRRLLPLGACRPVTAEVAP